MDFETLWSERIINITTIELESTIAHLNNPFPDKVAIS
jgi:hypothetical protein